MHNELIGLGSLMIVGFICCGIAIAMLAHEINRLEENLNNLIKATTQLAANSTTLAKRTLRPVDFGR